MIANKRIVLTGANSGIGLETLRLLVQGSNNKILAVSRRSDQIEKFDRNKVIPFRVDISSKEGVDTLFRVAEKELGGIDILFCNAGFSYYESFTYEDWDKIAKLIATNVLSPLYSYQKYYNYLEGKPGHFAVTISAMGKMALPGYAVYTASKFALQGFQEAIRLERHRNIKVTAIYPVATATAFFRENADPKFKKPFPMQQPADVARAIVRGLKKQKKYVNPCKIFPPVRVLMAVFPFFRNAYWQREYHKFKYYLEETAEGWGERDG
ncbi:MAG: SDR family NAD(P)-dependent oxidoreductase [Firmicutes bacterium]|nr:SDR family NAD(P)-dependent oxidoreductase [Bacillota bacterium]